MSKNFIVANIARWIREGHDKVTEESRPHVIPITPEAISAVENYVESKHGVCSGPFGGFIDAISTIVYDGGLRLAFRFKNLDEESGLNAVEQAEDWLSEQGTSRLDKIGAIRDMLPQLYEQGRFELGKEIMGGIHPDNFSGVEDKVVRQIWTELKDALKRS